MVAVMVAVIEVRVVAVAIITPTAVVVVEATTTTPRATVVVDMVDIKGEEKDMVDIKEEEIKVGGAKVTMPVVVGGGSLPSHARLSPIKEALSQPPYFHCCNKISPLRVQI